MAEVLLARALPDAEVTSAGTSYEGGVGAARGSLRAMAARGLALDTHRSRRLGREMLDEADLVIGMAREHVREAVVSNPGSFSKTFTIKELVRRGESVGPRRPDQSVEDWLAEVHEGRRTGDLLGEDPRDDVGDPMGGPDEDFEETAVEIEALVSRLVALLRI